MGIAFNPVNNIYATFVTLDGLITLLKIDLSAP